LIEHSKLDRFFTVEGHFFRRSSFGSTASRAMAKGSRTAQRDRPYHPKTLPFLYQARGQSSQVVDRALKTLPFLYQKKDFQGKVPVGPHRDYQTLPAVT
jgi:hypothetical protein